MCQQTSLVSLFAQFLTPINCKRLCKQPPLFSAHHSPAKSRTGPGHFPYPRSSYMSECPTIRASPTRAEKKEMGGN